MLHSSGLVKVNGHYGQGVFEIKSQDIIEFGTAHLKPISEEMGFIYEEKKKYTGKSHKKVLFQLTTEETRRRGKTCRPR